MVQSVVMLQQKVHPPKFRYLVQKEGTPKETITQGCKYQQAVNTGLF